MAQSNFFPSRPDLTPQIYAYSDPRYEGMLKVGYTTRDVQNWMRNRNTIEFLGLWESLHNPALTVCNSTRLEPRQVLIVS